VKIPKIVHRIYLDDPLPAQFKWNGEKWRRLHPGWEVYDWLDSNEIPKLVNQELFDSAKEIYPRDWKRFQSDVLRLELLYQFGGVYSDTDVYPRRNLESAIKDSKCFAAYSPQRMKRKHPITNAVMGSVKVHPYIRQLIVTLKDSVKQHTGKPLAQCTGPWHLTRVFESGRWDDVNVFPSRMMYNTLVRHSWNTKARREGRGVW
jgi:mannosyltransferase OCH1-like enzyme